MPLYTEQVRELWDRDKRMIRRKLNFDFELLELNTEISERQNDSVISMKIMKELKSMSLQDLCKKRDEIQHNLEELRNDQRIVRIQMQRARTGHTDNVTKTKLLHYLEIGNKLDRAQKLLATLDGKKVSEIAKVKKVISKYKSEFQMAEENLDSALTENILFIPDGTHDPYISEDENHEVRAIEQKRLVHRNHSHGYPLKPSRRP